MNMAFFTALPALSRSHHVKHSGINERVQVSGVKQVVKRVATRYAATRPEPVRLRACLSPACPPTPLLPAIRGGCGGLLPAAGLPGLLSGALPPGALHRVPRQGDVQLLPRLLQLLAGLAARTPHVQVEPPAATVAQARQPNNDPTVY